MSAQLEIGEEAMLERLSYTALLITQGEENLYSVSMPSEVLARTCFIDTRNEEPESGFQRMLNRQRAQDIANYIDSGAGTIPGSIVLSAQEAAEARYESKKRTFSFNNHKRSFLVLDGQHRVFGFQLAKSRMRVPVVIYMGLSRAMECRLFMDINTKQRPVPNELLLDIKRLAETEGESEAIFREVFDRLGVVPDSPLHGMMSATEKRAGKISRVTFNKAMKSIESSFEGADVEEIYASLSAYIAAVCAGLRQFDLEKKITNPTLFRAWMMLFPSAAERVSSRGDFSAENFGEVLRPIFEKVKKSTFERPGSNITTISTLFEDKLKASFSIARRPN